METPTWIIAICSIFSLIISIIALVRVNKAMIVNQTFKNEKSTGDLNMNDNQFNNNKFERCNKAFSIGNK